MKILGYDFTIEKRGSVDELNACGRFHAKSLKIQIADDLTSEQEMSTLLHEIIEAINYSLALGLEHRVIMGLEAGLYQTLKDNGVDMTPLVTK